MKVSLVPQAERDLIGGAQYYARAAGAELGHAFIAEFERSTSLLAQEPLLGAPWRGAVRRLPMRRFPYSVVYTIVADELRVLAVAHQRRKPGFWIRRR
ncbi:type II toxin-antitoxin system RelE/ParE family toxin [Pelomonas sp. KK5]|uniref:type II toxin-antitoxin system RelE/ParE family toxin n=1 Tax=Pelomonas sp. KK5 TaxID=1855730 RepID=UPI00097C8893|nr:type II toxin-antitoxin system RelE/ParE family toxin [Pelomonas sp. KK5]